MERTKFVAFACCIALFSLITNPNFSFAEGESKVAQFKTGSQFDAELAKGIGLVRSKIELRELINDLQKQSQIAILIDPRLDPSQRISVNIENVSFDLALNLISEKVKAKAKRIHNSILLMPMEESLLIRTLIANQSNKQSKRRANFEWENLATSQELLLSFEEKYGIKIQNPDIVPHDLWYQGAIPDASSVETLAILLSPFDLFFEWTEDRNTVRIVSMPKSASLKKRLNAGKYSQKEAIAMIQEQFPGIKIQAFGKRTLEIDSTIDNIEEIESMLSKKLNKPKTNIRKYVPLERRRYDLKVDRKPAISLIKSLAVSGVSIEYDEKVLRSSGIDLDTPLTFEVKKATIEELMKAVCTPVQLEFRIKGETVSLFAKE